MNNIIYHSEELSNRLEKNNLRNTITAWAAVYITQIMSAILSDGYNGKTVDIEKYSDKHRTSISRFLREDRWDDTKLIKGLKQNVIHTIYEEAEKTNSPVYVIIDDTISSKTIPSSRAKNPIEDAGFHFSHLKGKQDYGHQAVGVLLSCNNITLNYDFIMYDKSVSKIDLVIQIAEEIPTAPTTSYLLCDSWYVCDKIINAFIRKGFYTIGAMKTNRNIYPYGAKMSVSDFAGKLVEAKCKELFHLVTVKGNQYYVYRYEGNLKGIENAVVLLSYPKNAFGNEKALKVFISTNVSVSTEQILGFYVVRWEIEVYFRDCKNKLAIDKYQIRSSKGIKRLWVIYSLTYNIVCMESDTYNFSVGYHLLCNKMCIERVSFIFDYAVSGGDKSALINMFL